jgi:lipopolysaccharide/colanic/teichoic acid biosynthesis glycosyltransferase
VTARSLTMLAADYDRLPERMKNPAVLSYYDMLKEKRIALVFKRVFDIILSLILLVVLLPLFIVVAIIIRVDSPGGVFFKQKRITKHGKAFNIIKFRTMYRHDDTLDSGLTTASDNRITGVGKRLRKHRLDEIPQLFNILFGSMSFVGTRPELESYVKEYTPEMMATLLLPAGLTSRASILYRNEAELLEQQPDVRTTYLQQLLPAKMCFNLEYLRDFRLIEDIKILYKTFFMHN